MTRYFFRLQSQTRVYGPFTASELRGLAKTGRLRPSDLVSPDDSRRWIPAALVRGLTFVDAADPFADGNDADSAISAGSASLALEIQSAVSAAQPGSEHDLTVTEDLILPENRAVAWGVVPEGRAITVPDIARAPFTSWTLAEAGLNCLTAVSWLIAMAGSSWLLDARNAGPVAQGIAAGLCGLILSVHLLRRYLATCRSVILDNNKHGIGWGRSISLAVILGLLGPIPLALAGAALVWSTTQGVLWIAASSILCVFGAVWTALAHPMFLIQLAVTRRLDIHRSLAWVWRALSDILAILGGLMVATGLLSAIVVLGAMFLGLPSLQDQTTLLGVGLLLQMAAQYVSTAYYVMICLAVRRNGIAGTTLHSLPTAEDSSLSTFSIRSLFTASSPS